MTPSTRLLPLLGLLSLGLAGCTGGECKTGTAGGATLSFSEPAVVWTTAPRAPVVDATTGEEVGDLLAAETLELPAGEYLVAAEAGVAPVGDDGYSEAYGLLQDTVQTLTVCGDETTALEWAYELLPASRHLWATTGEALSGWAPATLASGGAPAPDLQVSIPVTNDLRSLAFDKMGNVWVATSDTYDTRLLVFEPGAMGEGGTPDPRVTLTNTPFSEHLSISELAFAPTGALLISANTSYSNFEGLLAFERLPLLTALAAPGSLTVEPSAISPVGTGIAPADIAFDGSGDLWLTGAGDGYVYRVAADAAMAGDDLTSSTQITVMVDDITLRGPTDLAFDLDGSLEVNFWTDGAFVRLAAADLAATGARTVTPDEVVTPDVLSLPSGLAITPGGTIWVGDSGALSTLDGAMGISLGDIPSPTDVVVWPAP